MIYKKIEKNKKPEQEAFRTEKSFLFLICEIINDKP